MIEYKDVYLKCEVCQQDPCLRVTVTTKDGTVDFEKCNMDGSGSADWQEITREEFLEEV